MGIYQTEQPLYSNGNSKKMRETYRLVEYIYKLISDHDLISSIYEKQSTQ